MTNHYVTESARLWYLFGRQSDIAATNYKVGCTVHVFIKKCSVRHLNNVRWFFCLGPRPMCWRSGRCLLSLNATTNSCAVVKYLVLWSIEAFIRFHVFLSVSVQPASLTWPAHPTPFSLIWTGTEKEIPVSSVGQAIARSARRLLLLLACPNDPVISRHKKKVELNILPEHGVLSWDGQTCDLW